MTTNRNNLNIKNARQTLKNMMAWLAISFLALSGACGDGESIRDALHTEVRGTSQCAASQCPLDSMQK